MSLPLLNIGDEEGESNVTLLVTSSTTMESVLKPKEFNYLGLSSDCSSVDSSVPIPSFSDETKSNLNLKATELRLGLPGSLSPERDSDLCLRSFDEKPLFPLHPQIDDHHSSSKSAVLGNKRGFSDAMNGFLEVNYNYQFNLRGFIYFIWQNYSRGRLFDGSSGTPQIFMQGKLKPNSSTMLENVGAQQAKAKEIAIAKVGLERPHGVGEIRPSLDGAANNGNSIAPATK